MRIRELTIRNFRKIRDLTVEFPPGLAVLVGENNAGKTAVIDALRLILFPGRDFDALRLNEDDFRRGAERAAIEISCSFCDLSPSDEARFLECLVKVADDKFEVRLNVRAEFNPLTSRVNVKAWGGETEGGSLPSNLYDNISSVYLQPLRDPESGLRPGRHSQVARLIRRLTPEDKKEDFENIVETANIGIRDLDSVKAARTDINDQMRQIAGDKLTQETELIFSDPEFSRIIGGLFPEIDGLPFGLNGLGYNNLVFTAATLSTLRKSDQFSFRSIIIEEPEAHLHPQLQVLLLKYLSIVSAEKGGNEVQVIVSSHSPILASQAPVDAIVSIHETDGGDVVSVSIASLPFNEITKKKLRRYLDATRGELFFARRVLMVEGIAEVLLLPLLAYASGGDLKKAAVTIVNVDGINFDAFLPLFGNNALRIPVAILTDGDADRIGGNPSATAVALKGREADIPNLRVKLSARTFEHELARNPTFLGWMVAALKVLHPQIGADIEDALALIVGDDAKADYFYEEVFKERDTSKGRFAQELATLIDEKLILAEDVPAYISEALSFLEVIPDANEASAAPQGDNPGAAAD